MNAIVTDEPNSDSISEQPVKRIRRNDVEYVLLGTAHVSRASVEAVEHLLASETFDAIAIELCEGRAQNMRDPEAFKRMDLFQVIKQGKTGMVAASLALASFQARLAEQYGIEPGAEMKAAMQGADTLDTPLWLIDREIGTTLKRAWRRLGFKEKFQVFMGLIASVVEREDISEEDIEKLKQGDILEGAFNEFAESSSTLYNSLITERDTFMSAKLQGYADAAQDTVKKVLVVIGAGHLKGIAQSLVEGIEQPHEVCRELETTPAKARWPKWLGIGILVLIFGAIGLAFHHNMALGQQAIKTWILFTGGCAAAGALITGSHPLSIIAAFIAAPIKPFRPGIPAGAIAALTEAWIRKPKVADFEHLRKAIMSWKGWWTNRVARTMLLFMLVNIGTLIGEYIAGVKIVGSLF